MAVAHVEFCWEPSEEEERALVVAVAQALTSALQLPLGDPTVIGVKRERTLSVPPRTAGDRFTLVTVTMFSGRTMATKRGSTDGS
jgi:hypothetical protein